MSKYNVGDKFIIEIGTLHGIRATRDLIDMDNAPETLYRIAGFKSLVFDNAGLDKLERYDSDEKANADYNAGYAEGLQDLWNAYYKMFGMSLADRSKCFGIALMADMIGAGMTPGRFIECLRNWEQRENEIKVGDEIIYNKMALVVTHIFPDTYVSGIDSTGSMYCAYRNDIRKTGRHFPQIAEVLEQMKGETK